MQVLMKGFMQNILYSIKSYTNLFIFQSAEAKFRIRQSEVSTAGLFSDVELFKQQVGPTAKPTPHDKWLESTAALTIEQIYYP